MATQNTILTQSDFEALTTNPYFSNTNNNYYYSTTLGNLPQIIANVEVNLNAMLNGRLYRRYNPSNLKFNGYNGLSPQVEQKTLLQCLTECVEYRLITQQYVNLNNTYSGVVNGTNNYNTANSNVIGLRQDIQAKLSVLGLYANILLGDKKPNSVLMTDTTGGTNVINYNNLQEGITFIQQTNGTFNGTLTFNGSVDFANETSFFRMLQLDSGWGTPYFTCNKDLYGTSGSNIVLYGGNYSATLNGITYTFPQSMLDLTTPGNLNLADWSFFSNSISDTTTTSSFEVLGGYTITNPTMAINSTAPTSITVIKCHYQTINSLSASTLASASGYDSTNNAININSMLKALYPTLSWLGTISKEQLSNLGLSNTSIQNANTIEQVVDKVVGKVNVISLLTGSPGVGTNTTVIDPLFQEVGTASGIPTYSNDTLSLTGHFTYTNYSTGTISPVYTSPVNSQGLVLPLNQVVSQLNILIDVYLTVTLLS